MTEKKFKQLKMEPGKVYCFVGVNGTGKSEFLQEIWMEIEKKQQNDREWSRSNMAIFMDPLKNFPLYHNNDTEGAPYSLSNEIIGYIWNFFSMLEQYHIQRGNKEQNLYIFMDHVDCGLSPDSIQDVSIVINELWHKCRKYKIKCTFFLTANTFELCRYYDCWSAFECYDVTEFKLRKFKTYKQFWDFIENDRAEYDRRRREAIGCGEFEDIIDTFDKGGDA